MKKNKKRKKFFTLIEILVVLTIIVILIGLIIVGTEGSRKLSRDKRRMSDIAAYQVALQQYYNKEKSFPNYGSGQVACEAAGGTYTTPSGSQPGFCQLQTVLYLSTFPKKDLFETFLSPLPKDPSSPEKNYGYAVTDNGKDYKLSAILEADTKAMENDGGTSAQLYEVFSTMGSSMAIYYQALLKLSGPALQCIVKAENQCSGFKALRLSKLTNAHAGGNSYPYVICCTLYPASGGLSTNCTNADNVFLRLSQAVPIGNSHAEAPNNSPLVYSADNQRACLSLASSTSYRITCTAIAGNQSCENQGYSSVCSISGAKNAHLGEIGAYGGSAQKKICCKLVGS